MICINKECQEFQDSLKEQLDQKNEIIEFLTRQIREKDQLLMMYKELDDK